MIANLLLYCPHPLKAPIWRALQTIAYTAIWQARILRKATLSKNVTKPYKTTVGSAYVSIIPQPVNFCCAGSQCFLKCVRIAVRCCLRIFLLVSLLDPVFVR